MLHAEGAVVVRAWSTDERNSYRIAFVRAGRRRCCEVVFRNIHEVAVALNLSGGEVWWDMEPASVAELVMTAVELHGAEYIRQVSAADLLVNGQIVNGTVTEEQLRRQDQAWGGRRRAQDCTDAAFKLSCAARSGELAPSASLPAPRLAAVGGGR